MRLAWRAAMVGLLLAAATAQAETVLRVVPHADLKNIDPIWTTAYITRNHGYMIYDTLFALDENLEVLSMKKRKEEAAQKEDQELIVEDNPNLLLEISGRNHGIRDAN